MIKEETTWVVTVLGSKRRKSFRTNDVDFVTDFVARMPTKDKGKTGPAAKVYVTKIVTTTVTTLLSPSEFEALMVETRCDA